MKILFVCAIITTTGRASSVFPLSYKRIVARIFLRLFSKKITKNKKFTVLRVTAVSSKQNKNENIENTTIYFSPAVTHQIKCKLGPIKSLPPN